MATYEQIKKLAEREKTAQDQVDEIKMLVRKVYPIEVSINPDILEKTEQLCDEQGIPVFKQRENNLLCAKTYTELYRIITI